MPSSPDQPRGSAARNQPVQDEGGNAIVEFVFLAVMLMVPTVYSLLAISHAQAGAYAAVAAAQQSLQVIEAGDRSAVSGSAVSQAAGFAVQDYGFDPAQVSTEVSCTGDCTAERVIRVRVSVGVDAPFFGWVSDHGVMTMTSELGIWGGKYE